MGTGVEGQIQSWSDVLVFGKTGKTTKPYPKKSEIKCPVNVCKAIPAGMQ